MANGFVQLVLLGRDHSEIVPGFGVLGAQLHSLLEIVTSLRQVALAQIERAEVVVSLGVLRVGGGDLFERLGGGIEVAMLKQCDTVSEIVTLELPAIAPP